MNPFGLTPRQLEVLRLCGKGLCIKEIASELRLSAKTVEGYWQEITKRMNTRSQFVIALRAHDAGLI